MRNIIQDLRSQSEIEAFEENHPDYYLANVFLPDYENQGVELSYYNEDADAMITVHDDGQVSDEQDILKRGKDIKELNLTDDTMSFDEALNHARSAFDISEGFQRIMGVLQTREQNEWNITLITKSFNVFNATLNADTGEVLSTGEDDVMSWIQSME